MVGKRLVIPLMEHATGWAVSELAAVVLLYWDVSVRFVRGDWDGHRQPQELLMKGAPPRVFEAWMATEVEAVVVAACHLSLAIQEASWAGDCGQSDGHDVPASRHHSCQDRG